MIKVFVIDDSSLVRNEFKKIFDNVRDIELIGTAPNPIDAFEVFKSVGLPDVFILDIEMPKMGGLEFLELVNKQKPIPVIICSTLVSNGSISAIDAMRMGAVDVINKPNISFGKFFDDTADEIISKVRDVANANVKFHSHLHTKTSLNITKQSNKILSASKKIVAIGASTGGVQVIEELIEALRENHPPIVIVQHMPVGFTNSFANRLNSISTYSNIKEAQNGDRLLPSRILIAPGNLHMEVKKSELSYEIVLKDYPKVNSHKPSINVLFTSMAKEVGAKGVGIILTGMGDDGARGLLLMRESGAKTYAQDEKSCVVYGMPKKAIECNAVEQSCSISDMVDIINNLR
jgi:two-component system chemotaxis response regulator CheB